MNKYFPASNQAGKNRQFGAPRLGNFCCCLLMVWAGLNGYPVNAATVSAPGLTTNTKPSDDKPAATFQLYITRHAHKQSGDATERDPRLSVCGEAQAAALEFGNQIPSNQKTEPSTPAAKETVERFKG